MALLAHAMAHALIAEALGGHPALISGTDAWGEGSALGERDVVLVGLSGSVANGAIALLSWLVFRRQVGRPTTVALVAWLAFGVNAWIPVTHLMASPASGFGAWATVIDVFPNRGPLRASLVATGLFMAGLLWKETKTTLARLVGNGSSADRTTRARSVTRWAWSAGGCVAVVAALFSPPAPFWAMGIAAGSTFGATWPLLPAAATVAEQPVPGSPLVVERSWPVVLLGAAAAALLIGVFGPGIQAGG